MRILVDLNHPAHVHLFKNAIREWEKRGDEVRITARDKDVTRELLRNLGLGYEPTASAKDGLLGRLFEALEMDWRVWQVARAFDPDFLIGTSFSVAHVSKVVRGKSVVFGEDDLKSSRAFWSITRPFADYIVTPDTIPDRFGLKHIRYAGCHELAYLHPARFNADKEALQAQGLDTRKPYSIMRFVSLRAVHDTGQRGMDAGLALALFDFLSSQGNVVISSEAELPEELRKHALSVPPENLHDLLAHARILVSDSQTMTVEAAVLGTPSVRVNTFVGRTPVVEELERKYKLTFGFLPDQKGAILSKVKEIMESDSDDGAWQARRVQLLQDKVDLTQWMLDLLDRLMEGENLA